MDVEKLTELWLTFCVNNNNDIDLTLDSLVEMENTILKKDYKLHDLTTENNMNKKESMDKRGFNANRDTYPLYMYIILQNHLYFVSSGQTLYSITAF